MKNPEMAGLVRLGAEEKDNVVLEELVTNYAQRKEPAEHKQLLKRN